MMATVTTTATTTLKQQGPLHGAGYIALATTTTTSSGDKLEREHCKRATGQQVRSRNESRPATLQAAPKHAALNPTGARCHVQQG